jgi:hypothetical protein
MVAIPTPAVVIAGFSSPPDICREHHVIFEMRIEWQISEKIARMNRLPDFSSGKHAGMNIGINFIFFKISGSYGIKWLSTECIPITFSSAKIIIETGQRENDGTGYSGFFIMEM